MRWEEHLPHFLYPKFHAHSYSDIKHNEDTKKNFAVKWE